MKRFNSKSIHHFAAILVVVLGTCASISAKNMFTWRLVGCQTLNFVNEQALEEFEQFMEKEIKPNGYNAVLFDGGPMAKLHTYDEKVKMRVQQTLAKAKQLGIAVIPSSNGQVLPHGKGEGFEEAFANVGTPFLVSGDAGLVSAPPIVLNDPGFEQPSHQNWKGAKFEQDFEVKHSGLSSARITNPPIYGQLTQYVQVVPHRTYELSVFVKLSKDVSWTKNVGFVVRAGGKNLLKKRDSNRNRINASMLGGDWFLHTDSFNSRNYSSVQIRVITTEKKGTTGTFWFDDVSIKEVGLQNVVRRMSLPIRVRTASTKKGYVEGQDFVVSDERLSIPQGSSIANGEKLLVDWYGAATFETRVPPSAFCGEEIWAEVRDQIVRVDDWFQSPPVRKIKYSEWRTAGWDPACIRDFQIDVKGSGPYYGYVAQRTVNMVRTANSNREVIIPNDEFDPYHNSKQNYCAVNGGTFGSWAGLSEDVIVINWNVSNKPKSLEFFAGTNDSLWPGYGVKKTRQRQIISVGYFGETHWGHWLSALDSLEDAGTLPDGSVIGINYHTWRNTFHNVGPMADFFKAAGRWGTGPIEFPDANIRPGNPAPLHAVTGMRIGKASRAVQTLLFEVPQNRRVSLSLFNLKGRRVSTLLNEQISAGTYERKIDTSKMAPGVYFVRLAVQAGNDASMRLTSTELSAGSAGFRGTAQQQVTRKMVVFQ